MVQEIIGSTMKLCKSCNKYLPDKEFSKAKSSSDGLFYSCKECNRKYRKRINETFYSFSVEDMCKIIKYDPETGIFYDLEGAPKNITLDKDGYIQICVSSKRIRAHRLALFLLTGFWGKCGDHINGNIKDNRAVNLRWSSVRENRCNSKHHRNGRLIGASYHPTLNKWECCWRSNENNGYGGLYDTEEEASLVYCRQAIQKGVRREFLHVPFSDIELGIEIEEFSSETERGDKGFGSTGE